MLIVLAGLPGTGKTTLAVALARALDAVHVRIDSIEQALRESSWNAGRPIDEAGYRAGYALAEDNLRLGHVVIADSVNPWPVTRDGWADVARRAAVPVLEVEVVCSDVSEHRRRVETRATDVPGLALPTWEEVIGRDYRPWDRDRVVVDTANAIDRCVGVIRARLPPPS
ncbi:MAG TPA: AAA family ATPase [Vicinamibacterales bacterium]|nr:AAA family ATPase [Vicinamibacterales bacterium]